MSRTSYTSTVLMAGLVVVVALLLARTGQTQIVIDFEDGDLDVWDFIDEAAENIGGEAPSIWSIRQSQHGLDGNVLHQASNIWGTALDESVMGTFAIYNAAEFDNFIVEVDVFTEDNDGMGLVWAYSDTDRHYRVIMVNDAWPDPPIDGIQGPFMKLQKRFSNDEPWHELISVVKEDYVDYDETSPLHWGLGCATARSRSHARTGLRSLGTTTSSDPGASDCSSILTRLSSTISR